MRIAIDGMGGDHAPDEIVSGVIEAARQLPDVKLQIRDIGIQTLDRSPQSVTCPQAPVTHDRKKGQGPQVYVEKVDQNTSALQEGEAVEFEITTGPKGEQASNVRKV